MADLVDPDKPESDAAYINRKHSEGVAEAAKIPKWCPVCDPERDDVGWTRGTWILEAQPQSDSRSCRRVCCACLDCFDVSIFESDLKLLELLNEIKLCPRHAVLLLEAPVDH